MEHLKMNIYEENMGRIEEIMLTIDKEENKEELIKEALQFIQKNKEILETPSSNKIQIVQRKANKIIYVDFK